jgi:hypothetical protein
MKKARWISGNHMLFESECKTFNRQCDLITTGNVWGVVQFSQFIRPTNEVECNGATFKPGELRDFDLKPFSLHQFPSVRKAVMEYANAGKKIILYKFRHFNGQKEIIHGFVITDANYKLLKKFITRPTYKSWSVIEEAIKYITEEEALPLAE